MVSEINGDFLRKLFLCTCSVFNAPGEGVTLGILAVGFKKTRVMPLADTGKKFDDVHWV